MTFDPSDPDHELAGVRHEQAFHTRAFVGREAFLDAPSATASRTSSPDRPLRAG